MATKYWCGISATWNTASSRWALAPPGIVFSGSRSGTTLTVTTIYAGSIIPGAVGTGPILYSNTGTASGTITAQLTPLLGNEVLGGVGRYTTSATGTITGPIDMYTILAGQTTTVPGSTDYVVFGNMSVGSPIITGSSTVSVSGFLVSSPRSGNYTFIGANNIAVSTTFTLAAGTVWSNSAALTFPGTCTITTNNVTIPAAVSITGSTHLLSLSGNFNGTGSLTLTAGTLTLNNYNWTCSTVSISGLSTKTIAFGASGTITTTSSNTTVISCTSTDKVLLFTGTPLFVLSGSPTTGARTVSFTSDTFGGSTQTMPGIKVPNGSDVVTLTVPLSSTYSNYRALYFSGFTGTLNFTNQASTMYIYGDFYIPNITINNQPYNSYLLSGPNGSLISINKSDIVGLNLQDNYVQSGNIACPLIYSNVNAVLTFNNSGTINITSTSTNLGFSRLSANFTGPVTATFDTPLFGSVTGSGTVTINTNTWAHVSSTLPTTATVNVSADNGTLTDVANALYAYTLNILGAGTGGVRTIAGYTTSTNINYLISTYIGPNLNITTGAGDVVFSASSTNDYEFNPTFNTINTTGFTGTNIGGYVCVSSNLRIPQTLTLAGFNVASTVGATVTLNAGTSTYTYICNYNSTTTLSGGCNFTDLTNFGNLNFGSATVNTNSLTLYGKSTPSEFVTYYGAANLGSATVNINTIITAYANSVSSSGTSTIRLLGTSSANFFGGVILNNVVVASTGPHLFYNNTTSSAYIENLTNSVSPATINFYGYFKFNTFGLSGTAGNPVTVTRYLTFANPILGKTTAWVVGANSVDAGNNIGAISYTGSSPDWLVLSYLTVGYSYITPVDEGATVAAIAGEGSANVWSESSEGASSVAATTNSNKLFSQTVSNASSVADSLTAQGGFYSTAVGAYANIKDGQSYYDFDLNSYVSISDVTADIPYSDSFFEDSSTVGETLTAGFDFASSADEFANLQDVTDLLNFNVSSSFEDSSTVSDIYDLALFLIISANAASVSAANANLNLRVPLSTVDGAGAATNKVLVSASASIALNKILAFLNGQGVISNALLADLKLTKPISSSVVSLVSIDGKLSLSSNLTSSAAVRTTVANAPVTVGKNLSVYALVTPNGSGDVQLTKPISASAFSTTLFDSLLAVYHAVALENYSATTADATVTTIFLDVVPQSVSADVVPQFVSADVVSLEIHLITPNAM